MYQLAAYTHFEQVDMLVYYSLIILKNTRELLGCTVGGNVSTCSVYTFRTSPYVVY